MPVRTLPAAVVLETASTVTIAVELRRDWFDANREAVGAVLDLVEDAITKARIVIQDTPPADGGQ